MVSRSHKNVFYSGIQFYVSSRNVEISKKYIYIGSAVCEEVFARISEISEIGN